MRQGIGCVLAEAAARQPGRGAALPGGLAVRVPQRRAPSSAPDRQCPASSCCSTSRRGLQRGPAPAVAAHRRAGGATLALCSPPTRPGPCRSRPRSRSTTCCPRPSTRWSWCAGCRPCAAWPRWPPSAGSATSCSHPTCRSEAASARSCAAVPSRRPRGPARRRRRACTSRRGVCRRRVSPISTMPRPTRLRRRCTTRPSSGGRSPSPTCSPRRSSGNRAADGEPPILVAAHAGPPCGAGAAAAGRIC